MLSATRRPLGQFWATSSTVLAGKLNVLYASQYFAEVDSMDGPLGKGTHTEAGINSRIITCTEHVVAILLARNGL